MTATVWTSEAIGQALGSVHLDGSSWLVNNWRRDYRDLKFFLVDCIRYNHGWDRVTSKPEAVGKLLEWVKVTPDWERIIRDDDVAMFPPVLRRFKVFLMVNMDKEFCESVNRLSYLAVTGDNRELYHRSLQSLRASYGVFRFRCIIGDNLFKVLRRHLQVTLDEFESVYGEALLADLDCCDELLIEMLVSGRLRGSVRSYKIEREYYE